MPVNGAFQEVGIMESLAAVIAAVVAVAALVFQFVLFRLQRHSLQVQALLGEKEAVAQAALQLRRRRFSGKKPLSRLSFTSWTGSQRQELIEALCIAALFERADRSLALVHRALKDASATHLEEVSTTLTDLKTILEYYKADLDKLESIEDGQKKPEVRDGLSRGDRAVGEHLKRLSALQLILDHHSREVPIELSMRP